MITRKSEVERPRPKVLQRLAREIAAGATGPTVLLHGAGSFGHPGAQRFGLAKPPGPAAGPRARGAAIVAAEVRRLHAKVIQSLLEVGTNPVSVPAFVFARNRAGRLSVLDEGPVRASLDAGMLPVSFGDVVLDEEWGFSILSGDTLAVEFARRLGARRVVFVSDVAGVYRTQAPGRPTTVPTITAETLARLQDGPARGADVTGGIRGKVEAMLAIAANGCDAGLISGLSDGALSRALRGETVYGSWARASSG